MKNCLFIILAIILIWHIRLYLIEHKHMAMSNVDGKVYAVDDKFDDYQKASDILARLNIINKTVISRMQKKYVNSANVDAQFLADNYNGDALSEHLPADAANTSYVINKGDSIKLCLRDKDTKKFHDMNTLVFVNLHELSHLLDKEYGHTEAFWTGFNAVLKEAVELGFYMPVNYSVKPTKYCGMMITTSPLF